VTFFAFRFWAGCIISISGFDLRQAQRDHNAGEKKKFHSQRLFPIERVLEAAAGVLTVGEHIFIAARRRRTCGSKIKRAPTEAASHCEGGDR